MTPVLETIGHLRQQMGQLFGAPVQYALVASLCLAYANRRPGTKIECNFNWRKVRSGTLPSELVLNLSERTLQNWIHEVVSAFDQAAEADPTAPTNRPPTFALDEIAISVSAAGVGTVLFPSEPESDWRCGVDGAESDEKLAAHWSAASSELSRALQCEPVVELSRVLVGRPSGRQSGPTLTMVHGADGSAAPFAPLVARLAIPLRTMRYVPSRAQACTSVGELADFYATRLLQLEPRETYWVGGHSFGAIVACEMARYLRARGKIVRPVLSLDSPMSLGLRREPDRRGEFVMLLEALFSREECEQYLATCPSTSDIEARIGQRMAPARAREILRNRAKCLELLHSYDWSDRILLDGCFHIRATEPLLSESDVLPDNTRRPGRYVGGNHFSMLAEPHVGQIAQLIESQAADL